MDETLKQILTELFRSHQTIDSLVAQIKQRDQKIAELVAQDEERKAGTEAKEPVAPV